MYLKFHVAVYFKQCLLQNNATLNTSRCFSQFCALLLFLKILFFLNRVCFIFFLLIDLQLSDLESSLLNLSDPQLNNVQLVLDDYDKKVSSTLKRYFLGNCKNRKNIGQRKRKNIKQ